MDRVEYYALATIYIALIETSLKEDILPTNTVAPIRALYHFLQLKAIELRIDTENQPYHWIEKGVENGIDR